MRITKFCLFFVLIIPLSPSVMAWERLEQLVIPASRALAVDEEKRFSDAVNALVSGKTQVAADALAPLAADGVVDAQMALGTLLSQSELEADKKQAMKWLYFAAHGGNWRAQINLSHAFRDGKFTEVSYKKAREWLQRAEIKGDANVIAEEEIALNNTTLQAAVRSVENNEYKTAEQWLTELAEEGVLDAQEKLARLYQTGFLGEDSKQKADKWLRKAAERGSKNAQFELAMSYLNDRNATKELKSEGIKLLSRAAQPGPAEAQYQLGLHYLIGDLVEKNQKQGIFYYRMAAEQGHVEAQYSLGVRYVLGEGVSKDEYEAHRWFKNAANQGLAKAMHNLALTYLYGMGTDKQPQKADQWFRSAANNGVSKSGTFLKPAIMNSATPELISASGNTEMPKNQGKVISQTTSKEIIARSKKKSKPAEKYQTVYGADWFINLPSKGYTLQLLSAVKKNSVDNFFVKNNLKKNNYLHYIDRTTKKNLHVIQYGYYESMTKAQQAAKKISRNNKRFKPWIREVRTIKNKIANL